MRMRQAAMTFGAVLLGTAVAAAQTATEPQRREQQRPDQAQQQQRPDQRPGAARDQQAARAGVTEADRTLATCLAIENQAEIEVSEFAVQHLKNARAKQFAQQMSRDHRALLEKLQAYGVEPWTGTAGAARGDVSVRAGQTDVDVQVNRPAGESPRAERAEQVAEQRAARTADGQLDFAAIKREIAQQCVQSTKRELETTDQPDVCYIGGQLVAHHQMLAALKVFQRHASPQLNETLAQATQVTQQHLEDAKQIMKSLMAPGSTAAAENVGTIAP